MALWVAPVSEAQSGPNDLFLPPPAGARAPVRPQALRSSVVTIAFGAFWDSASPIRPPSTSKIPPGAGTSIRMSLPNGRVITVRGEHAASRPFDAGFTWSGKIPGTVPGLAVFVVDADEQMLTGSVTVEGSTFAVSPLGNGVHLVTEQNPKQIPGDGEPLSQGNAGLTRPSQTVAPADTGSVIDVLVVYTPAMEQYAGSTAAMYQLIDTFISESNSIFASSGMQTRLRLVGRSLVGYTESGYADVDNTRLSNTTDGYLDIVPQMREQIGADIVALLVRGPLSVSYDHSESLCGQAREVIASADRAYGVVNASGCGVTVYSFTHEMMHLVGARHDWYADDTLDTPFPYNHGYVAPNFAWRTVMATTDCGGAPSGGCSRIAYFSNPALTYLGQALGAPVSSSRPTDNHRLIDERAPIVVNFKQSLPVGPTAANDAFASATSITGSSLPVTYAAATGLATTEPESGEWTTLSGCVSNDGTLIGHTVWYKLANLSQSSITISTADSNFDTVLVVYRGTTLNGLTQIACNDDAPGLGNRSLLTFSPTPGQTYYVQAGGYGIDNGQIRVAFSGVVTYQSLAITKAGSGSGTVSSNPTGISCGSTCGANYVTGTSVALTATPAAGSVFSGWSGACAGANGCTVYMSTGQSVTATFTRLAQADLSVSATASSPSLILGQNLDYQISVRNNGPDNATSALLAIGGYVATDQPACTGQMYLQNGTVYCDLGVIAPSSGATAQYRARPPQAGVYSRTFSVSAEEADLAPSNNSATVSTNVVCSTPRPRVGVQAVNNGDGRLRVTITAGAGALQAIQFGDSTQRPSVPTNASISIISPAGGPSGIVTTYTYPLTSAVTSVTFLVERRGAAPTTVPLVVTDGCGPWRTFVGGGMSGF